MSGETTQFGEVTNARRYLEALEQVEGLYASLREDVESVAELLGGLDLADGVTSALDWIGEALYTAENAASNARTDFENEYGDLIEFVESGKTVPGLDPFFADCAS
jgi:hypothetical protein